MTWPINVAEELKDAQILGELKQSVDYTTLTNAQLSYKGAILRSGSLRQMMRILANSLEKSRRLVCLSPQNQNLHLEHSADGNFSSRRDQRTYPKRRECHLVGSSHFSKSRSYSRSSFDLYLRRGDRTILSSGEFVFPDPPLSLILCNATNRSSLTVRVDRSIRIGKRFTTFISDGSSSRFNRLRTLEHGRIGYITSSLPNGQT